MKVKDNMFDVKKYRKDLGYTNQTNLKAFFDSKDIIRDVDFDYICKLNKRLIEIIHSIDNAVIADIKPNDLDCFIDININKVYKYMLENNLIHKFSNNKQRQTERSYYDWSRGRIIANYFKKAMSIIFNVKEEKIKTIGLDNLDNPASFSKAPTADFEIKTKKNGIFRIEFQCGFQGVIDIKEHKVLEASRVYKNDNIRSLIIHVDLFNGCVAFVDISNIDEKNINWEYRQQFEGKKVFNINKKYFVWNLSEKPPTLDVVLNNL